MKKKILSVLLVITAIMIMLPIASSAASPVTSTVDLTGLNNDTFGQGYAWDNLDCILTLNSLDLNTTDAIGFKLPANSTVILNGNNKISATSYGIQCLGALTFKGDGTLTVSASICGITGLSTKLTDSVVFRSGTVTVKNAKTGIYAENSELVFSGATVNVNASEYSLSGKNIKIVSGALTLEGTVKAKGTLTISNTSVSIIGTKGKAIDAELGTVLTDVDISTGSTLSALTSSDEYKGENAIKTVATKNTVNKGFLFGGKLPAFVDYIALALIISGAAAVIIVPIIIKRKKTAALIAKSEAAKNKKSKKK